MSQRKIIFFHLPKTGGTALRETLLALFLREETQLIYNRENFQKDVRDFAVNKKLIAAGHMGWERELDSLLSEVTKITCLRNPVSNVISHYLHFKNSHAPEHREYGRMSFPEFLESPLASNWQCKRLGGGFYDTHMDEQQYFEEALKNVTESFAAVGLTEQMDQSLALLRDVLGLKLQKVPVRNTSADPEAAAQLQSFAAEIRERNRLDEELYRAAAQRFSAYFSTAQL